MAARADQPLAGLGIWWRNRRLILIVLYLIERLHPQKWTMPKRWYVVILFVFFVLGASFITWKDQQSENISTPKKVDDLTEKQRSLTQSDFSIETLSDIFAELPSGAQATWIIRLDNRGASAAIRG